MQWANMNICGDRLHQYSCALTTNSLSASEHQRICSKPTCRMLWQSVSLCNSSSVSKRCWKLTCSKRRSVRVPGKQLSKKIILTIDGANTHLLVIFHFMKITLSKPVEVNFSISTFHFIWFSVNVHFCYILLKGFTQLLSQTDEQFKGWAPKK